MTSIAERVARGDWGALAALDAGAPIDAAALAPLARALDPSVRELAVRCLGWSPDPLAARLLLDALVDPIAQVRLVATRGLTGRAQPVPYPDLIAALDASFDPYVREQLVLLAGASPAARLDDLARARREPVEDVREAYRAAAARLGDPDAQRDFVWALQSSRGHARRRRLAEAEYIGARWVLAALAPLLDDTTAVSRVGSDAAPHDVEYVRACDMVVESVARISRRAFSFTIPAINYAPEAIDEVRRFLV